MFKKFLLLISGLFVSNSPLANDEVMDISFTIDNNVQKVAEAYSLDCIDFVENKFNLTLDWSNESVFKLESILGSLSDYAQSNKLPQEDIDGFAKMFGFYIGEVYRKNHQDIIWGFVTIQGNKYHSVGNKSTSKAILWPVANVHKRISLGEEANIAHYYSAVIGK